MTITIPNWLLWLVGIPAGIVALALMAAGVQFLRLMLGFRWH